MMNGGTGSGNTQVGGAEATDSVATKKAPLRCLLVDDSTSDLTTLSNCLRELGHHPRAIQDPQRVEEALGIESFDLLMVDIVMPERNGYAVLRSLKKSHPGLPVVLVSSKGEESDVTWGIAQGAAGYLVKPYDVGALKSCLAGVSV